MSDGLVEEASGPPGVDVVRASAWIAHALPELSPPFEFTRIGHGHSNLTYLVTGAGGGEVVLRRPPLGELLPSAHDMAREHRILAALAPAGAAVPVPRALCEDETVLGAPFYLMDFARGVIMTTVASAG